MEQKCLEQTLSISFRFLSWRPFRNPYVDFPHVYLRPGSVSTDAALILQDSQGESRNSVF